MGPDKIEGGSIVLLGSFNPAIFQPLWFAQQGLIPAGEADSAEIQIVHREVSSFSLEWLGVQVTQERFSASTADAAHLEPLRDLVVGTFSVLEHTPVSKMGMNSDMHLRLDSQESVTTFGDHLAPRELWKHFLLSSRFDSLRVAGRRREDIEGRVKLTIQPSIRLVPGMYFGFNEHYEAEEKGSVHELMAVLSEHWRLYQVWTKETALHLLADLLGE